jgi:hypothetical protein
VGPKWDPSYAHCDIHFQDGMASSALRGEKTYWKTLLLSKPGYSRVTLGVNQTRAPRFASGESRCPCARCFTLYNTLIGEGRYRRRHRDRCIAHSRIAHSTQGPQNHLPGALGHQRGREGGGEGGKKVGREGGGRG